MTTSQRLLATACLAMALPLSACTHTSPADARHGETPSAEPAASGAAHRLRPPVELGGGERFLPAPTGADPQLSSAAAWRTYAHAMHAKINRDQIPRGTYAVLGVFIDGGGRQHLAYGYFTPGSAAAYAGPVVPSPPVKCIQWEMLGADTGRQIEGSWLCPPTSFSPVAYPSQRNVRSAASPVSRVILSRG